MQMIFQIRITFGRFEKKTEGKYWRIAGFLFDVGSCKNNGECQQDASQSSANKTFYGDCF